MKRFLVIGLGQFGYELAKALTDKGAEVIAIDRNMNLVEGVKDFVTSAVNLDSTDEDAVRSLNLDGIEAAIVAIGKTGLRVFLPPQFLKNWVLKIS